jgi:replicative DNA helicase
MLLDATVLDETSIRPEQFYSDAMARIFQAMQRMRRAGTPIDTVTLAEELIAAGQLENVGGLAVMAELLDTVTHSAHASYYAALIAEK